MSNRDPMKNFIAGGIGGACRVTIGHPFDTIKIRLQTTSASAIRGSFDCATKTIYGEGFRALYKGMSVPLMTGIPFSAIYFGGCALGRWVYHRESNQPLTFTGNLGVGALSGGFTMLIASPADRIKGILQVQSKVVKYSGPFDAAKKLLIEGGLPCLYQGTSATLLKGCVSGALYMSVYDYLKKRFSTSKIPDKLDPWAVIGAGGLAGLTVGLMCLPLDVLKSRIQTAPRGKYPKGIRDVLKEILRQDGWNAARTFTRGWIPIVIRTFPSNSACFIGIEITLWTLDAFKYK